MKLTPLEIRKADFRRALRGFETGEVRIFLDMVAVEYEKLLQENGMLSEKIRHMSERLEEYHDLEKTLQSSILTAERIGAESQERSRREAEGLIEDARIRGERILEDARERLRRLSREIQELRSQKDLFVSRFQTMLASQAQLLESQHGELDKVDAMDARASSLIAGDAVAAPHEISAEESLVGEELGTPSSENATWAGAAGAPESAAESLAAPDEAPAREPQRDAPAERLSPHAAADDGLFAAEAVPVPIDRELGREEDQGQPDRSGFFRDSGSREGFFRPGGEEGAGP